MPLFGSPNIDKHLKKGNVGKLVELLTHRENNVSSSALNALQQITHDVRLENDRKKNWTLSYYDGILDRIEKLDKKTQASLKELTQKIESEKNKYQINLETIRRVKVEIKKRFEETFTTLGELTKELHNRLWSIIQVDKEFLFTHSDPGKYRNSAFSGVIVTKDEIIYFEQMRYNRALSIRLDEITDIEKPRNADSKFKVTVRNKKWISLGPKLYDVEMIDFIEKIYIKKRSGQ